jgi:hypothetical protein
MREENQQQASLCSLPRAISLGLAFKRLQTINALSKW